MQMINHTTTLKMQIEFNGSKYDARLLISKAKGTGHNAEVETKNIVVSEEPFVAAEHEKAPLVAVQHDGKYHLLQGRLPPDKDAHTLRVISKPVLKACKLVAFDVETHATEQPKAAAQPSGLQLLEKRLQQRERETRQRRPMSRQAY